MTSSGPPVRLVLVDDHEMVIEGLKAMLAAFGDRVEVVGQAVGAERAGRVVDALDPDIVLCDVRMQGASGLDLCLELRESDPERRVVMLSVYDDEQYLFQACGSARRGTCSRASAATSWYASSSSYTAARRPSTPAWRRGRSTPPPGCSATNSGRAPGKG